ncbi:acyl-CoA dehydrogenase family protein [Variovorax sp. efr-133-TYG-130]|uniref:acyl-CoA dehydrogenase family protein n=1 Tax=Variovorax sp. efr-133-TYG-130 TaxID=3040327 RepID=UPI002555E824|nr:acyl-CoA dehydrogenase family protein [Variovorax sp. efr-133-TYG-130]
MSQSPWMTPELENFRDNVRRFYDKELVPNEERWGRQQHVDREVWRKAGAAGLLCVGISEEYGGGGGNFMHEAILFYEQTLAIVPGLGNGVHTGIVAHYLENFGTEAQKQQWLPRMASGDLVGALAISEPGAGSDVQAIQTRAVRRDDHYVVNGAKTFISNGQLADLVCVVVKTDPSAGSRGISLLMVETAKVQGFRRGRVLDKIGMHAQDTSELFFDDMRVPCANLLGPEEGQGFRQLMKELPRERVVTAMSAQGSMDRAIAETLAYARQRKLFGDTLFDFQNTRFKLAECQTKATVSRAFIDRCIDQLARGELDATTAAMAKWWCTQTCGEIVDECLQLHGGYGYMTEYPIARIYQNVRIGRILAGSNEVMKELVARDMRRASE